MPFSSLPPRRRPDHEVIACAIECGNGGSVGADRHGAGDLARRDADPRAPAHVDEREPVRASDGRNRAVAGERRRRYTERELPAPQLLTRLRDEDAGGRADRAYPPLSDVGQRRCPLERNALHPTRRRLDAPDRDRLRPANDDRRCVRPDGDRFCTCHRDDQRSARTVVDVPDRDVARACGRQSASVGAERDTFDRLSCVDEALDVLASLDRRDQATSRLGARIDAERLDAQKRGEVDLAVEVRSGGLDEAAGDREVSLRNRFASLTKGEHPEQHGRERQADESERGTTRDANSASMLANFLSGEDVLGHSVQRRREIGDGIAKATVAERQLLACVRPTEVDEARLVVKCAT